MQNNKRLTILVILHGIEHIKIYHYSINLQYLGHFCKNQYQKKLRNTSSLVSVSMEVSPPLHEFWGLIEGFDLLLVNQYFIVHFQ